MKKLQKRIMRLYTAVCAAVLGALGFTACGWQADMYGVPMTDYQINGRVTDMAGEPLEGIKVSYYHSLSGDTLSTVTDEEGHVDLYWERAITYEDNVLCFEDVDGEENGGKFANDTMRIDSMERKLVEERDGWHQGVYELSFEKRLKREVDGE